MNSVNRRLGLEQEFFLVDRQGVISNKADLFLERCQQAAAARNRSPDCFAPEFVKSIVEINTPPVHSLAELAHEYLAILQVAIEVGRELDLRLYPLATYPLHTAPVVRNKPNALLQMRTVGPKHFANAAKCAGTHLHLELPPGIIDRRIGVSYDSSAEEREELISLYNLVTALDAAVIALSRACPFYDGRVAGLAMRTIHYRGSREFAWEGVYTDLQPVGGLMPYVETIDDLVEQQFYRYYTWLQAMDEAGVERQMFWDSGGELLEAGWNPVRLNQLGTVELRGMDSNYPAVTLALVALIVQAANRIWREGITVRPKPGAKTFILEDKKLWVPEFDYLNGELLYGAVTEGVEHQAVSEYLDSLIEFSAAAGNLSDPSAGSEKGRTGCAPQERDADFLDRLKTSGRAYRTTEAELLEKFPSPTGELTCQEGLALVVYCCEQLERQVAELISQTPRLC